MPIEALRSEINGIDEQIIDLIARRQHLAARMAQVKMNDGLPIHDEKRTHEVLFLSFNSDISHLFKFNSTSLV